MKNQRNKPIVPAATEIAGPASFPVGSIESRAAARAKLEQSLAGRVRTTNLMIGFPGPSDVRIGDWFEHDDGSLTRNVIAPGEISEEDSLTIFGVRRNPLHGQMGVYIIHH